LLRVLITLVKQIKALEAQINEQLDLHADVQIFTGLPRSGVARAAWLLAEIGDCRVRFPDPSSCRGASSCAATGPTASVAARCAAGWCYAVRPAGRTSTVSLPEAVSGRPT
jgi:transposase